LINYQSIFSVSNLITLFRGFLSLPIFYLLKNNYLIYSLILIIIAIITDWVDGFIARLLKEKSQLGKILDPACDFLVVVSIILYLISDITKNFPIWFIIFYCIRQLTITISFFYSINKFKELNGSNIMGKWTIFLISISLFFYTIGFIDYGYYSLLTSTFSAVVSWFFYLKKNLRQ